MSIFQKVIAHLLKLAVSGMLLAAALLLPFLTGQIPQIGAMLCPMHIPVIICGFVCGWSWGLAVGLAAPLLRSLLFAMPPMFPTAVAMAFELAAYGALTGLLYARLPKKLPYIYVSLVSSMIAGRFVWGAVRFAIAGFGKTTFGFAEFWAGAVIGSLPGIALQIVLIPLLIAALRRARLMNP